MSGTVGLMTSDGLVTRPTLWQMDGLAVSANVEENGFACTHARSGYLVGMFRLPEEAIAFAIDALQVGNWDVDAPMGRDSWLSNEFLTDKQRFDVGMLLQWHGAIRVRTPSGRAS